MSEQTDNEHDHQSSAARRFLGAALLGAGILVIAVSSLGSAVVLVVGFAISMTSIDGFVETARLPAFLLLFAGVCLLAGFGMFRLGRWLLS